MSRAEDNLKTFEDIRCDGQFSVNFGPNHNRSDQEIHYIIADRKSNETFELHGSFWEESIFLRLMKWYKEKKLSHHSNVLQKLRTASKEREKHWNPSGDPIPSSFRVIELAGEVGEVANAAKKLLRHEMGMVGGTADMTNFKEELGDVLISLELLAASHNVDLWDCVVEKFNKTSDKHGFPIKMDKEGNIVRSKAKGLPSPITLIENIKGKAVVKDRHGKIIGLQG